MSDRERLNSAQSSCPVERVDLPCGGQTWRTHPRGRSLQTALRSPKCVGSVGLILILAGIAMVVIGAEVSKGVLNSPTDISRNQEGVPLSGLNSQSPVEFDCQVNLKDFEAYKEAFRRAETKSFGKPVSNLTTTELKGFLGDLPKVSLALTFWIFHGQSSIGNDITQQIVSLQVAALNKAFDGSNINFFLHGSGIHHVYVDNGNELNCHDKTYTRNFISKINSVSAVAILVCSLEEMNGLSGILGDTHQPEYDNFYLREDGESELGVIYMSASALKNSHTSLVHQVGHFFGLAHPYPSYETCRVDGDMITDTEMVYRPSNSCIIQESSLCQPERARILQYSPGKLYMDISPDSCRDRFTPGQILRMHAMISEAIPSGAKYVNGRGKIIDSPMKNIFLHAFQPNLPSENILEHQMNLYFQGVDAYMIKQSFADYSNPFLRLSEYAMLAVRDDITSSSFSCIEKRDTSRMQNFWIGSLKFKADIQGIEITLEESLTHLNQHENPHLVMVHISESYDGNLQNCTSKFVPLKSLTQIIYCDTTVSGSVVKLIFMGDQRQDICIRNIYMFGREIEDDPSIFKSRAGFSSAINMARARQSSTSDNLFAENALVSPSDSALGKCSTTSSESKATWILYLRSPFLIDSVSFDIVACPLKIRNLESSPGIISRATRVLKKCTDDENLPLKVTISNDDRTKDCTTRLLSQQGGFNLVHCRQIGEANAIQVQHVSDSKEPLSICNIQVKGSRIVSLLQIAVLTMQDMYPNNGDYLLPMDNNEKSCIKVNSWEFEPPYWKAQLKEPAKVHAIIVKGTGKNVTASLSDIKGQKQWTSVVNVNGTVATTRDGVVSSILTISGFEQLCEVLIGIE